MKQGIWNWVGNEVEWCSGSQAGVSGFEWPSAIENQQHRGVTHMWRWVRDKATQYATWLKQNITLTLSCNYHHHTTMCHPPLPLTGSDPNSPSEPQCKFLLTLVLIWAVSPPACKSLTKCPNTGQTLHTLWMGVYWCIMVVSMLIRLTAGQYWLIITVAVSQFRGGECF